MENEKYIKTVIEQYHLNERDLSRLNENRYIQILFEKCNLVLYDNDELIEKVKDITVDILNFYKNPNNINVTDARISPVNARTLYDEKYKMDTKFFSFDLNMSLINKLFVCVSFGEVFDSYFVDNTVNIEHMDGIKIYNSDFIIYSINRPNVTMPASLRNNLSYEYATVHIVFDQFTKLTKKTLMTILLHEIQHIYDVFDYESYASMNSDALFFDLIDFEYNTKIEIDSLMNNRTITTDELKKKVRTLKKDSVRYLFNHYVTYFCNLSEMRSRLVNFKSQIDAVNFSDKQEYSEDNTFYRCNFFRRHSETFNQYYIIHELLKLLIDYFPIKLKMDIATSDIKKLYDYQFQHKRINGYVYKTSFKHKSIYDDVSFDDFCKFHLNRLRNVFFSYAIEYNGNKKIFERFMFPMSGLKPSPI